MKNMAKELLATWKIAVSWRKALLT